MLVRLGTQVQALLRLNANGGALRGRPSVDLLLVVQEVGERRGGLQEVCVIDLLGESQEVI